MLSPAFAKSGAIFGVLMISGCVRPKNGGFRRSRRLAEGLHEVGERRQPAVQSAFHAAVEQIVGRFVGEGVLSQLDGGPHRRRRGRLP